MSVLAARHGRPTTLPMHANVLLCGSERIMEGSFATVTQNLLKLGTCPIENLAHSPKADLEGFDLPNVSSDFELLPASSKSPPDLGAIVSDDKESQKVHSSMQFVAQLHQTCVGAFGNSEALKFEFLEESGQEDKKQCILTITRPNGQIRSYTTAAEFQRKSDAKARAAAIAIEMGAIDFILHGNKDASNNRSKILLAPVDVSTTVNPEVKVEESSPVPDQLVDAASKQIESLCEEWRASKVRPRWVFFNEQKSAMSWGCALVIELSPHSQRLYSINPLRGSKELAKKSCSETALREGVVDYIKYGNGQTAPARVVDDPFGEVLSKREPDIDRRGRLAGISLQAFFDCLPKPFPEPIGDKPITSINVPGLLNTTLQLAKGARLNLQYYFLNEGGLHGSIMRVACPGETKTYMVDPRFTKRSDAKSAVCLQAMSQGITQYIRSLAAAVDNKVTSDMRRLANEQILPILGSEYGKLRSGMHPAYDYGHDSNAFSCTMTLSLCADPKPNETRSWSVKPEYRTKTDAKIAVVCHAGAEAIEFLRFRGQPPPPGHDPFKPYRPKERDNIAEHRSNGHTKRTSTTNGTGRPDSSAAPLLETKEEARARQIAAARWEHAEITPPRAYHRPSTFTRPAPRYPSPPTGPSNQYESPRKRIPLPKASYDRPSASSYTVDRGTGSFVNSAAPSRTHEPNHQYTPRNSSPITQSHEYSQADIAKLRPPRKSQLNQQSSHRPFSPLSQPPQQPSQQSPPLQPSTSPPNPLAIPPQPSPPAQQFQPFATPPPPHPYAYPSAPYPPGYPSPYPYPPMPQGAQYPLPPSGYPFPASSPPPPPGYGIPPYPPYAGYYADPRYAPYAQYGIPGPPVPYAVPVAPPPGMQYPTPPEPAPAPSNSTQLNTPESTPPSQAKAGTRSSAQWIEIGISTASFSAERDNQKRPRSRDMSMSPDDLPLNKKHRSESSLHQAAVKQESIAAPPTPVSATKDNSSNVQQLLRYCEAEGLSSPEFGSKQTKNERGEDVFKVWIVMGKERLELPVTFSSEDEGRQRVSKQVLQRLRSQAAKK